MSNSAHKDQITPAVSQFVTSQTATVRTAPTLRPYQVDALAAVRREHDLGRRSTLAVLATGLGKAVIAAALCSERADARLLLVAPREELIDQLVAKLAAVGIAAGIEQASRRSKGERVVVASPATLRGDRLTAFAPDAFAYLVLDEAHHANARTWHDIVRHFATAKVLGLTATPHRADGRALGDVFESVAYRYELRQAIADRWLAPIVARRIVLADVDLSSVRTRAGDLAPEELAEVMEREGAVSAVVTPLLEQAGTRRTLVFATSIAHGRALTNAINRQRPGAARFGWGDMPSADREALLVDYRAGAFQFLVNVQLYTEGFDEPSVACIAMVRPTKSLALYVQMCGRGTRLLGLTLAESIANGKPDLLLLDFTGQCGRHKLVGPIDCLLGEIGALADDVREALEERLAGDATELERAYELARGDAIVRYLAVEVDPFIGPDGNGPLPEAPWSDEPIPAALLAELKRQGINIDRLPSTMRHAHAARLMSRLDLRRRTKLCSLKQARKIAPSGIETRSLSAVRASQMFAKLRTHGWKPWALETEPEAVEARRARTQARIARERGEERAA